MKIGYAFYGHLCDNKIDENGVLKSTPDGNATYSWSIIRYLQKHFNRVYRLMPNLDKYAEERDKVLFTFSIKERLKMMKKLINIDMLKDERLPKLDLVLLEWRWPIEGRNTKADIGKDCYTPDLRIQEKILNQYTGNVIAFDLDYKMTLKDINDDRIKKVFELGYKNTNLEKVKHVEIPFDFKEMLTTFSVPITDIVYIGNRYERDKSVEEWLNPLAEHGFKVDCYGNWLEKGRDSKNRWPNINFSMRVQVSDFRTIYGRSKCTILLAKEEYYEHGFMTMRILEAIMFGCLPIGLRKHKGIEKYLPSYLIADGIEDIEGIILKCNNNFWRINEIKKLKDRLRFMDVRLFCTELLKK